MVDRLTFAVFSDGYMTPRSIGTRYVDKMMFITQAEMFGFRIAYFINVKLKEINREQNKTLRTSLGERESSPSVDRSSHP